MAAASGWITGTRDTSRIPPIEHWQSMADRDDELSHNVGQYWLDRIQSGPRWRRRNRWKSACCASQATTSLRGSPPKPSPNGSRTCAPGLRYDNLIAWGYCQHLATYLPTDALIAEGGYEVINANWYTTNGPAPFAPGIDGEIQRRFKSLRQQI